MTDDRFFRRSAPIALGEIAAHVGGELLAPAAASFLVRDVAALDCAKAGELSVFCDGSVHWLDDSTQLGVITGASANINNGYWEMLFLSSDNGSLPQDVYNQ